MNLREALNSLALGNEWATFDSTRKAAAIGAVFTDTRHLTEAVAWVAAMLGPPHSLSAAKEILGFFFEKHVGSLAETYDRERSPLSAYCRRRLRWMCSDYRDKHKHDPLPESPDAPEHADSTDIEALCRRSEIWAFIHQMLDPGEALLLELSFLHGYSCQELAKRFHITPAAARMKKMRALLSARVQLQRKGVRTTQDIL